MFFEQLCLNQTRMDFALLYKRLQEFIFWRRPLTTGFFYLIAHVIFIAGYFLHFNSPCSLLVGLLLWNLWSISSNETREFFFQPEIDDSKNKNSDRIRSNEEVEEVVCRCKDNCKRFARAMKKFGKDPNLEMLLMFFFFSISSFVVSALLGSWFIAYLMMNAFFIIPVFIVNSGFRVFLLKLFRSKNNKEDSTHQ